MLVYGRDMTTSTLQTNKSIVILKRRKVKELKAHLNKTQIAKRLAVAPAFIRKWWDREDVETDNRRWVKGRLRKRTEKEKNRIIKIRERLVKNNAFFYGPDAVLQEYKESFPNLSLPPRSFVAETVSKNCKADRRTKRIAGGSRYLHYPQASIEKLGNIIQEIDFAGGRALKTERDLVHIFFWVYTQPFKLPQALRINVPRGQDALNILVEDWKRLPMPDILKMDNDVAFTVGGRYHEFSMSKFICTILNLGVTPLFTAYNKPWNNGCVEGANSVFVRKIIKKIYIENLNHLDRQIKRFNKAYLRRLQEIPRRITLSREFIAPIIKETKLRPDLKDPTVYFIRQVLEEEDSQIAIRVFKVPIKIDEQYLKQFVLAKLNVYQKRLAVFYEKTPGKLKMIKSISFSVKYH